MVTKEEFEVIYRSINYNIVLKDRKTEKYPFCINYDEFLEALLRISIKSKLNFQANIEKIRQNNYRPESKAENLKLITPGKRNDSEEEVKINFDKIRNTHFFDVNNITIVNYEIDEMFPEVLEAFILYLGISSNRYIANKKILECRKEINLYLDPKNKNEERKFLNFYFLFNIILNILQI